MAASSHPCCSPHRRHPRWAHDVVGRRGFGWSSWWAGPLPRALSLSHGRCGQDSAPLLQIWERAQQWPPTSPRRSSSIAEAAHVESLPHVRRRASIPFSSPYRHLQLLYRPMSMRRSSGTGLLATCRALPADARGCDAARRSPRRGVCRLPNSFEGRLAWRSSRELWTAHFPPMCSCAVDDALRRVPAMPEPPRISSHRRERKLRGLPFRARHCTFAKHHLRRACPGESLAPFPSFRRGARALSAPRPPAA